MLFRIRLCPKPKTPVPVSRMTISPSEEKIEEQDVCPPMSPVSIPEEGVDPLTPKNVKRVLSRI